MARRMNTRFVVILGAILLVGACTVVGIIMRNAWHRRDPVYLQQQGDEALARKDLLGAVRDYLAAANASSKSHREGTDALFTKLGDLEMKMSGEADNSSDAARFYRGARDAWKKALTENAGYVPAREKLIEEQYKVATYEPRPENWAAVEETASKLVQQDKSYGKGFTYLAAARFYLLESTAAMGVDMKKAMGVEDDIAKAIKADPSDPLPQVLRANLLQLEAVQLPRSDTKEAMRLFDDAKSGLSGYLAKHPNEPDTTGALARLHWGLKEHDEAMKMLKAAVAAHPGNVKLSSLLSSLYSEQQLYDDAEKVLTDLAAAAPSDAEAQEAVAHYYESLHKYPAAIAAFTKMLALPESGGGIAADLNIRRQIEGLFNIGWCYLDIAEGKRRANDAEGLKSALAQAEAFSAKLQQSQAAKSTWQLLDGRLQLVKGNYAGAISALKQADAVFSKSPSSSQWLETKVTLSQAHEMNTEWGNALMYVNQILTQYPRMASMVLQKARLLCRVARWTEAIELLRPFVSPAPGVVVPKDMVEDALGIEATAFRGLGKNDLAEQVLKQIGGTASVVAIIRNKFANGDLAGAMADTTKALKDAPDNVDLLTLAISINVRMDNKPAAIVILKEAMEKHPENDHFKVLNVLLTGKETDPMKLQLAAIDAISDPLTKHMARSNLFAQEKDRVGQMTELEAAKKSVEDSTNPRSKEVVGEISDQIFSLYLQWAQEAAAAADTAKTKAAGATGPAKAAAEKEEADQSASAKKYFDQAEVYVQRAQRLNLDGLDGKLYEGRFEFAKGGDSRRVGINTLEQVVAARPSNSVAHTVLGQAYYLNNRGVAGANNDKALEEFRQAIQQKPDNGVALRYAIEILIAKGDTQSLNEAKDYLTQAMAFTPNDPQLRRFDDVLGDTANSIMVREALRKKNPDDMDNLGRLARLYVKVGQVEKAIGLFKIIFTKYPDDLGLADTLAHLEHEAHHDNDALTVYDHFIASSDPKVNLTALLLLGDMYKLMGNSQEALRCFHDAIAKQPAGVDDAQRRIADLYFDMDAMKEAAASYAAIYKAGGSKDVRVLRRLVEAQVRAGEFAEAGKLTDALLKERPDDPDGWILRGFSLMRQNKSAEAIACFNHVIQDHPENVDALHYRALAQFTSHGDLQQAIQDLLTVRGRDPRRVNSRLLLAKIYRLTRQFALAADEYESVIKIEPDQPMVRIEYAQFLLSVAEVMTRLSPENRETFATTVRAVHAQSRLTALLQDSAERFPKQPVWDVLAGNLQTLEGMNADALVSLRQGYEASNDNAEAATPYLAALLRAKNYEDVVKLSTHLIGVAPGMGDYYVKRGDAYAMLHDNEKSLGDFGEALTLSGKDLDTYLAVVRDAERVLPEGTLAAFMSDRLKAKAEDTEARIGLAEVQLSHNHPKEAGETLSVLMADAKSPYRPTVLRMMGMVKYLEGDFKNSVAIYEELLKITPDDLEVLNNMAYMLAENLKKPKEGLVYAEHAVKILRAGRADLTFVNNGNVYDTYGWVKFLTGDVPGAIEAFNQALQVEPLAVTYLHLAKAQMKLGDKVQARLAAEEGMRLGKEKNDPVVPELEKIYKETGT